MLRRIVSFAVVLPAALLLLTLAVINRHGVRLVLDPFRPDEPVLSLVLPFYVYLFGVLVIGVLLGGAIVWRAQARWRHAARRRAGEVQRWRAEAERLNRERPHQAGRLIPSRP
jgi:uncharacterized integral membrane protein